MIEHLRKPLFCIPLSYWELKPSVGATLALLFFMPLLIFLGSWQFEKGVLKSELEHELDIAEKAPPLGLEMSLQTPAPSRVLSQGHYLPGFFLLDNRTRDGRAGYEVLALWQADDGPNEGAAAGKKWLVNMGWIEKPFYTGAKSDLARVAASKPDIALPADQQWLMAYTREWPEDFFQLGPETPDDSWPRIIQNPRKDLIEQLSGQQLFPIILMLSPDAEYGWRRDWQRDQLPPQRHFGYAIQWFLLALTLLLLWLGTSLKSRYPQSYKGENNE